MQVTVHDAVADIDSRAWNRLAGNEYPFLRHEFLYAAEETGCVSGDTGWWPRHLTIAGNTGLRAAMPLYEKSHSWGEFVFDWAWAQAYERVGLDYYPKLVSAVPFTPAPSRRLLLADPNDADAAAALMASAVTLAKESGCSSLHILFPTDDELPLLREAGLSIRKACQFHWHNRNYSSFDDFLATFSAAKRKKVKRERRRAAEAGISFRRLRGREIDAQTWGIVHRLISITFMQRGSLPYFDEGFFKTISEQLPDNILVVLAECEGESVAAAIFFESDRALYGRYWGAGSDYNALHFETCYYQGIDYCIEHGKEVFEPGTQGEHKISRGFVPVPTWSAHWLAQPELFAAVDNYVDAEARHIEEYMQAVDDHSPYRDDSQGPK